MIDDGIYSAFAGGYNSTSDNPLPPDWLRFSRICDINPMLCLLNHDNAPREWIDDIEADILSAVCGGA